MILSTTDAEFGVILVSQRNRLFRFQLVLRGDTVGDEHECGIGSAVYWMRDLPTRVDFSNLGSGEGRDIASLVLASDGMSDLARGPSAESLDQIEIYAWRFKETVNILAPGWSLSR